MSNSPARVRIQFGVRTLLLVMLILGPISGWYAPWIIRELRGLMSGGSQKATPATAAPSVTNSQQKLQQLQAQFDADRERLRQQRINDAVRSSLRSQRRINPNGTFNMKYHLPPSQP